MVDRIKGLLPGENDIAQIAISFCLAYDAVSTVIPGNKSIDQLIQNIDSTKKPIPNLLWKNFENLYHQEIEKLKIPW